MLFFSKKRDVNEHLVVRMEGTFRKRFAQVTIIPPTPPHQISHWEGLFTSFLSTAAQHGSQLTPLARLETWCVFHARSVPSRGAIYHGCQRRR
jgi:hypothetical protein